jgi:hypothetical protein
MADLDPAEEERESRDFVVMSGPGAGWDNASTRHEAMS